ncbi:MAG: HIT domain-containing protein [Candidatus Omnitrophica bacterium]|nr:HIT domain-containing protein [Candidatus Omnitrophota bacterium]
MDSLWAPWRSKYIYMRKHKRCIFCGKKKRDPAADKKAYLIDRSAHSFSMLNIYPYNNGHVMVAPFRHVKNLLALKADELADLFSLVRDCTKKLDRILKPHGYNIGLNIGKAAGAGFDGHVHVHIVPRWTGDTNFMTTVTDHRVISDSLDSVYKLLKKC